jgi:hypothetical protein
MTGGWSAETLKEMNMTTDDFSMKPDNSLIKSVVSYTSGFILISAFVLSSVA